MRATSPSLHRQPHPRRGDTTKVVLIVLVSLFGIMVLSCVGVGALGYFWIKKNFSQIAVTNPGEDFTSYTKSEHKATIRGKTCTFYLYRSRRSPATGFIAGCP
jgi:hypothetical protein